MFCATRSDKGFTLIELLIVIAVIALLAGVIATVLDADQYLKQARDSRRVKDILTVQAALTEALTTGKIALYGTNGCIECNSILGTTEVDGTGWVKFTNSRGVGLSEVIPVLPKDPINSGDLRFQFHSDGQKFEINAIMESEKYAIFAQEDGGNNPNVYERGTSLTIIN